MHDAPSLNRPTNSNDRVYAILKVGVMLNHPPGIELVLRKRICLRVVKKVGGFFTRLFTPAVTQCHTGVMYEVVTGIPKVGIVYMAITNAMINWFVVGRSVQTTKDSLKPSVIC